MDVKFLLTCLLRGMTGRNQDRQGYCNVSTHMPLARHDAPLHFQEYENEVSTHMPLARHD